MAKKKERMLPTGAGFEEIVKCAMDLGAKKAKIIPASSIVTAPWVRLRCQFGCPMYGHRLTCPPHSPTPEQTRAAIDCYETAILIEGDMLKVTGLAAALERQIFLAGYYKAMAMGGGPCVKCPKCSMEEGCKNAGEARPAMEACGVDVFQTVRGNGWEIEVVEDHRSVNRHIGVVLII